MVDYVLHPTDCTLGLRWFGQRMAKGGALGGEEKRKVRMINLSAKSPDREALFLCLEPHRHMAPTNIEPNYKKKKKGHFMG